MSTVTLRLVVEGGVGGAQPITRLASQPEVSPSPDSGSHLPSVRVQQLPLKFEYVYNTQLAVFSHAAAHAEADKK